MALVRIGGYNLPVNPETISWSYSFTTRDFQTVAGKVTQLLSCSIDSLTVGGRLRSLAEIERFEQFVLSAMSSDQSLQFAYPARDWYARVRLESFPSMAYSTDAVAPAFSLSMVVDEGLGELVKISQDAELARLVDGVRWVQSEYNDYTMMSLDMQQEMEQGIQLAVGEYAGSGATGMPNIAASPDTSTDAAGGSSDASGDVSSSWLDRVTSPVTIGSPGMMFDPRMGFGFLR